MGQKGKCKTKTIKKSFKFYKTTKLRKRGREKSSQHLIWQWFLGYDTKSTSNKSKNR